MAPNPVLQYTRAGLRVENRGEERDHHGGGGVCCVPILHCIGEVQRDRKQRAHAKVKYFATPFPVDHYLGHMRVGHPKKNSLASHAKLRMMPRRISFPRRFRLCTPSRALGATEGPLRFTGDAEIANDLICWHALWRGRRRGKSKVWGFRDFSRRYLRAKIL
jgi:hypothetical protein